MSLLKEELLAYDYVKAFLIKKRIFLTCDCGEMFYKNLRFSDEREIYAIVEKEFSNIYSDKKVYRERVKQLLQEASLNDICPYCCKKLK